MRFSSFSKRRVLSSCVISMSMLLLPINTVSATPVTTVRDVSTEQDKTYQQVMQLVENKAHTLAIKVLEKDNELFTDYTDEDGEWDTKGDESWCSGFVPGLYWYLFALTGNTQWQGYAKHWTEGVRSRAYATDNDTGFQIYDSFGLAYNLAGEQTADYKKVLIDGANTMVKERYNQNIGAFRSWKQWEDDPEALPFEVNIDQLMNMELILWVGKYANKPEYSKMAISHADKTWANNMRDNGSSYHVVEYDEDGKVENKRTHQGWKSESTWSRGQAWAVYAYVMYYRFTGLERMLQRSKISYQYYLSAMQKQSRDWIPYADFDAPLDEDNPRDSSAAAVVASALLELYKITNNEQYLSDAQAMLQSLATPKYLALDANYQSILLKGSEKWGEPEVGTIFGDYFFVEALYRWKNWINKPLAGDLAI